MQSFLNAHLQFGGDVNRVVIVGESSGATSVATLITCPRVKGLINGAIVMSNPYTAGLDPEGFGKEYERVPKLGH